MYTTRPKSLYKNSSEAISLPPEGRNSGYLVLQDEETTSTSTCCFGLFTDSSIKDLPFPQNMLLSINYRVSNGKASYTVMDEVYLIPVINQPLSFNRYYAIKADGKDKGEAYASSKEEDMETWCFCIPSVKDVNPRPFDPDDIYQQFEFSVTKSCLDDSLLLAKSVASDGYPPYFLRRRGWTLEAKTPKGFTLGEAQGLDSSLRAHFPDFNFLSSQECSKSMVVGKWYCPFVFIKEGKEKDQIINTAFYEMTLEQRWERIFAAQRSDNQGKTVTVDVVVPTETVKIAGEEAEQEETKNDTGVVWFRAIDGRGTEVLVGINSLIIERMMWEEESVGWVRKEEKRVKVVKDEEYQGIGEWTSFGCYVLVETYVLKKNDGSVVLTYDFRHTHKLRSKWE